MKGRVSYTLVSDGSSDRGLLPIINWLMRSKQPEWAIHAEWADLRLLPSVPRTLEDRIRHALDLYPCDVLAVHRDAERDPLDVRVREIARAIARAGDPPVPHVVAVPVRMTEAWLLFDEAAIRRAAGNPGGTVPLELPPRRDLEALPDPKAVLMDLLRRASELRGRRLKKLRPSRRASRVSEYIADFTPLMELPAFVAMSESVEKALQLLDSRTDSP